MSRLDSTTIILHKTHFKELLSRLRDMRAQALHNDVRVSQANLLGFLMLELISLEKEEALDLIHEYFPLTESYATYEEFLEVECAIPDTQEEIASKLLGSVPDFQDE